MYTSNPIWLGSFKHSGSWRVLTCEKRTKCMARWKRSSEIFYKAINHFNRLEYHKISSFWVCGVSVWRVVWKKWFYRTIEIFRRFSSPPNFGLVRTLLVFCEFIWEKKNAETRKEHIPHGHRHTGKKTLSFRKMLQDNKCIWLDFILFTRSLGYLNVVRVKQGMP